MNKIIKKTDNKSMSILYLEEDKDKRLYYTRLLKSICSKIHICTHTKEVITEYRRLSPTLFISDISQVGSPYLEVLSTLRKIDDEMFIIIISEHKDLKYLQDAIELQVSSYLIHPVEKSELEDAFDGIVKKCCKQKDKKSIYISKDLYYEANIQALVSGGHQVTLNKKEAKLLEYLLKSKNMILSYAKIQNYIWPGVNVNSASLRTLVKNLRKKGMEGLLQNISGSGYLLQVEGS